MWAFVLVACGTAPEPSAPPEPNPDAVELKSGLVLVPAPGDRREAKKSSATAGLLTVKGEDVDQNIGWGSTLKPLEDGALHERSLVFEALPGADASSAGPMTPVTILGKPGFSWAVDGDTTQFVGTVADVCGRRHTVVSFGPLLETVNAAHEKTVASIGCPKDAPAP
ncbi:MAG: hypothetical protein H6737_15560 [Alphaproteobacteria bacterium]|nr:hypothetical protein [Alphaproteobacteria bacterium]